MTGQRIGQVVATYLDHLAVEKGRSGNTLAAYRRDLDRYIEWLIAKDLPGIDDITPDDVEAYRADLTRGYGEHQPLSAASVARAVSSLRGMHKFAVAERHAAANPLADAPPTNLPTRLPKAISVEEVGQLLDAARFGDGPIPLRDTALLEFLYGTGSRITEAVTCAIDDLDLGAGAVTLHGKGGKTRTVPLGNYAVAAIEAYLVRGRPAMNPNGPGVFRNSRGGPLSRQGAWAIIQNIAERAGLTVHISPHTLRHSYATHLLDGGADVRVVQELLGHTSVVTTQVYTLVTVDRLREVYATSHPRARR
ncbi:site-specific tyrosine recombinase XerD [Phytomonospora endophytica]|uniref:Tyrosine recombinase XerC n=1 Tax=Phytomonospora endophytica TaxID=714109 RepID=A0A841FTR4_9ACTN|nr:site-specific tyrosine recombinase XerD [Phytomonospora endophytica]MBB6035919.1 integrase/recombinase XerD [Phytomonospora endophytica]GIG71084.1 tyrosine recombinase XerD [Phytomonospora endophytica]